MTLKDDMQQAFTDEAFRDVTLVGTDQVDVPGTKLVLAIRSPVFKRMFFGNFQERETDRVSLNYPSLVLQVLVKYCYSDELDLDMLYIDGTDDGLLTDAEAVLMVQLRDAANYFELSDLNINISNELGVSVVQKGDAMCVCAVLSELFIRGETEGPMWETMIAILEGEPQHCLLPVSNWNQGIVACSLPLFCDIMTLSVDVVIAVNAVQKWSQANSDLFHATEPTEDQKKVQKIADSINLDAMSTHELAQVKPCQVFSMERLYQAFVENGIRQSMDNVTPSNFRFSSKSKQLVAHVHGSGVLSANGTYAHNGGVSGRFCKLGVYGEITSIFQLLWQPENQKWEIRVVPPLFTVGHQEFVLYESSKTTKEEVPFGLWHCRDGQNPAPFVAIRTATHFVPNTDNTSTEGVSQELPFQYPVYKDSISPFDYAFSVTFNAANDDTAGGSTSARRRRQARR